jgi:hypothetical protein
MKNEYLKTKKYIILILLLIGSLNCGTTVVGYNFIEKINILLNNNFNTKYPIDKIIYLLVALAGILLVINRDLWLLCIEDFTTFIPLPSAKAKMGPPPGIPTNIVVSNSGHLSITITWNPPVVPSGTKIPWYKYYTIYCYEEHSNMSRFKNSIQIDVNQPRTYTFTNLNPNYNHSFQIQTVNNDGQFSPFSPKIYKRPTVMILQAPTLVKAKA